MEERFYVNLSGRFGILLALIAICHAVDFSYTPFGYSQPSMLLELDFEINIKALKGDTVLASFSEDSTHEDRISVFGVHGPRSLLRLRFQDIGLTWAFIFNEVSQQQVTLTRLIQFVPARIFPKVTGLSSELMFHGDATRDLHSASKSFACDRSVTTKYSPQHLIETGEHIDFKVSVTVSNLRIQAYNIKNGQFSPSVHCSEDSGIVKPTSAAPITTTSTSTTTTTTTTPTTTPTTPRAITTGIATATTPKEITKTTAATPTTHGNTLTTPEFINPQRDLALNSYVVYETVGNNTIACISMVGRLGFEISYQKYLNPFATMKETVTVAIPDEALTEGNCHLEPATQKLSIQFYNHWSIEFMISVNDESSVPHERGDAQSKLDYSIRSVTLKYTLDRTIFPKVYAYEGTNFTVRIPNHDQLPRKKTARQFFLCQATKRYQMDTNVVLLMSGVKFKAFIRDQDINFYGLPDMCLEDTNQKHHPIMVVAGCLIVTSSLMILIACTTLISVKCSFRKKRGYRPI